MSKNPISGPSIPIFLAASYPSFLEISSDIPGVRPDGLSAKISACCEGCGFL